MSTMTNAEKSEQAEATARLLEWVKPGDTLYTQVKNVSRSGMSRVIQVIQLENNEPRYLGYNVAQALGWSYDRKREGVKVSGCGMDMGFHLIYELSVKLFCTEGYDHDKAYSLKQRWL